jgi:hypothetical protein
MIIYNYKNWLSWSYNNTPHGYRTDINDSYKYHIDTTFIESPVLTYKDELYKSASLMRDCFTEPFDVLLSGGIDSEIVVRTFKDLGIKHKTFIFKYEDNLNYRDVESAIEICLSAGIDFNIIDFNLRDFFEKEAYQLFQKSGSLQAGRLPQLKFLDLLDNIPVTGNSEPYWKRSLLLDYSNKSEWLFPIREGDHNLSIYCHGQGRDSICDWYEFHPNVIKSFNMHPLIQNLLEDKIPGKLSSWSSRVPIHREIWPDIKEKPKLVGFEKNNIPGSCPEYIIELQKTMDQEIGGGQEYWYTEKELLKLF